MHKGRHKRRSTYEDLNNDSTKTQHSKRTAFSDDCSTLLHDSSQLPKYFNTPEIEAQEQVSADGSVRHSEGEGICRADVEKLQSPACHINVSQVITGSAAGLIISQKVDIPFSKNPPLTVRQEISGLDIGQACPVNINQVVSIPIQELNFPKLTAGNADHTNIQPVKSHHHSDSGEQSGVEQKNSAHDYSLVTPDLAKQLTEPFLKFLSLNNSNLLLLSVFIDGVIPPKFVEFPSMRSLVSTLGGEEQEKNLISREDLVELLSRFEEEFNLQLKHTLQSTHDLNLVVDSWTSVDQTSYMAIWVSFCPKLDLKRELHEEDVTACERPTSHILGFVELSAERCDSENIKAAVLTCLQPYSICSKIRSITLNNGSNNVSMLESLNRDLQQREENSTEGGIVNVRCMNLALNLIFEELLRPLETLNASLFSRIDKLTHLLKNNVNIRRKLRSYIAHAIPEHNDAVIFSRYFQLEAFLKVSRGVWTFYLENSYNPKYQLLPEDLPIFHYEKRDMEWVSLFVHLTTIFKELKLILRDDETSSLSSGIEYYMLMDSYFKSCDSIRNGSVDGNCLEDVGLNESHLSAPEDVQEQIFSAILKARPIFDEFKAIAHEEPGYWTAHMLQPGVKTYVLNEKFDTADRNRIQQMADRHVAWYIENFAEERKVSPIRDGKDSVNVGSLIDEKYKVLKNLKTLRAKFTANQSGSTNNDWQTYLAEPCEPGIGYLQYWLSNQKRWPELCSLALSFYYTRLSTSDVERCLSMSKEVLQNRFSLVSENLRRAVILRNRSKCFNLNPEMTMVRDIPLEEWINGDEEMQFRSVCAARSRRSWETTESPFSSDSSDLD
ncbi:putative transposase of the Rover hAT-like DNA transposon [Lachancea lanzarotensis]|uniref:LALA0S07e03928g1_1 n=1 Tax=Lachancea lanzarotensis TaxID=1245769 RepID=A0A0C7N5F8_9SACH|nr:putative transposase of the Rover hAT-like DNA transposon [Lachancea lanzarotensis]CEP63168.1 putative transposase of the Rover hAT-like DNA transposon [Lachancea lanzarotensis]